MKKLLDKSIIQINKDLFLIKLEPQAKGFEKFLGVWLYKCCEFNALIDVGPYVTANSLLSILKYLGIKHIDYIFLTHIHLDHYGAISKLTNLFKNTIVVCHEIGIPHLIDPKKLWEGSLKTLKKIAEFYGKPKSISKSVLVTSKLPKKICRNNMIRLINTPGHSSHHISISIGNYMFLGEAAGVLFRLSSGNIYMRPATPPPLFIDKYLSSIHYIIKTKPKLLCYAHLEIIDNQKYNILEQHCIQIELWKSIIRKSISVIGSDNKVELINDCINKLLDKDSFLHPIKHMSKEIKIRELFFIKNSVKGFIYNVLKV